MMNRSVSQGKWQAAQGNEDFYWETIGVAKIMENIIEKIVSLRLLGDDVATNAFDGKEILEIGVGPLALSLASFCEMKGKIKRLVKTDPLKRKECRALPEANKNAWAKQFFEWVHAVGEEGEYLQLATEEMDFNEEFDTLIAYNVLNHARDPVLVLQNSYNALKKKGMIILAVDCHSVAKLLKARFLTDIIRIKNWEAVVHPHIFLQDTIRRMLLRANFLKISCDNGHGGLGRCVGRSKRVIFIGYK